MKFAIHMDKWYFGDSLKAKYKNYPYFCFEIKFFTLHVSIVRILNNNILYTNCWFQTFYTLFSTNLILNGTKLFYVQLNEFFLTKSVKYLKSIVCESTWQNFDSLKCEVSKTEVEKLHYSFYFFS